MKYSIPAEGEHSTPVDAQENRSYAAAFLPTEKNWKQLGKIMLSVLKGCGDGSRLQGFQGCIDEEFYGWPPSLADGKGVQRFQRRVDQVDDVWVIFLPRCVTHTGLKNGIEESVHSVTSLWIFQFIVVNGLNGRIPGVFVLNLNLKFLKPLYTAPQNLGYDQNIYERG